MVWNEEKLFVGLLSSAIRAASTGLIKLFLCGWFAVTSVA